MALEWPDFSQATLTDARFLDALRFAFAERFAAAGARDGFYVQYPWTGYWEDATPDLDRPENLRLALRSLAPNFVRLEDESYRWQTWSRFPIAYSGNDLMKGEHSLAILPAPGTPEGDSARLEDYRTFLENCAWWLKQFRYVDVGGQSYYTLRSTARGSINIRDMDYWGHDEWGDEPETVMASPETRRVDQPATGYMIRNYHADSDRWEDDFYGRDTGWKYDIGHYQYRSVEATSYSGLVVRNFSGLPGSLILVPCYTHASRGTYPERRIETDFIESVMPTSCFDDDGDRMAETVLDTETREERHGDAWLETYRSVFGGRQWFEPLTETSAAVRHEGTWSKTKTNWSLDGSRRLDETESGESTDWYNYTIWERSTTYIDEFDGFGEWTLGVPVAGGVVPAHDRLVAIPERTEIPFPDVWNLTGFRRWRLGLHPRDRDDSVHYTAYLRIAPILDFNSSYLYQG